VNCGEGRVIVVNVSGPRLAVVFDRSQLWLHALVRVLAAVDVGVSASTTSPQEAVELVEEHKANLLVAGIDNGSTGAGDLESIQRAREQVPDLQVVVWSTVHDPRAVKAAFTAGAAAYVLKTARPDDLTLAIRQVFERSIYLAKDWPLPEEAGDAAAESRSGMLTHREREILQLVAEGYSNAQLARMLWVSAETIKFHLSNIYQKIEVTNRTEASRWAHLHGVARMESSSPPRTA
jgi:DNA-binding NarL/FixJ family response regulator